ncbi:hypothetical protein B0J14DRAFT_650535 [Halenospora varia]|nr:hypothetical protein B0J14DRAFT_650535 [Halenospora varia]
MLPSSLLGLAAAFYAPLIAAASAPTCTPNSNQYQVEKVVFLYKNFCNDLASKSFPTTNQFFFTPYISFGFTAGSGGCDEATCNTNYESLINACGVSNHIVTGTGSVDAGCGTYNMTIYPSNFVPGQDGTPSSIADVGTATTGILHNAAATSIARAIADSIGTLSTTSVSVASTSSSASSSSSVASTTSSSSFSSSSSSSSTVYSSTRTAGSTGTISGGLYQNTSVVLVTTQTQPPVSWTTGTSVVTPSASAKASASATLQGKSDADTVVVSGWSLVALACGFVAFM